MRAPIPQKREVLVDDQYAFGKNTKISHSTHKCVISLHLHDTRTISFQKIFMISLHMHTNLKWTSLVSSEDNLTFLNGGEPSGRDEKKGFSHPFVNKS